MIHMCVHACFVISVMSDSLCPCELQPARHLCPCDSPGKNTGVGCHALLQIFPTQGLNPHFLWFLNCRNSLLLSHWGSLILYIENPKDSYKKLLELINEFSKDAEHKINTNKNVMWAYSNNKLSEKIKETISFTITLKLIK